MPKFKLPVTWEAYGVIEIEAKNEKDFIRKVDIYREDDSALKLPDEKIYVDGSFLIDDDEVIVAENGGIRKFKWMDF